MTKRWITFDLDGTLMQNPFVEWVFPEIEGLVKKAYKNKDEIKKLLVSEHESRMARNLFVEAYDWDDIVSKVLKNEESLLPLKIDVEELVKKHCVSPKIFLLEDNIIETLEELRNRGFSLAAVTNGFYKYQFPVMDVLGLFRCFDKIVTPDAVGWGKPDVRILHTLADEGSIVAHIGDRIDHDVVLANRYGTLSVFITQKLPDTIKKLKPTERIHDDQVKGIVDRKWQLETKKEIPERDIDIYPKVVIGSISELLDLFLQ